jgi:hypothetical protein
LANHVGNGPKGLGVALGDDEHGYCLLASVRPKMYHLILATIEKCELTLRRDATGWHLSAKGALGVVTLLIIVLAVARLL